MKTRLLIAFLISIVVISCNSGLDTDVVAIVDTQIISVEEFQYRYNFNPYLRNINEQSKAKREVLAALLAEKLLAVESENSEKIKLEIENRVRQHLKEEMIEQIRRDSVEATVTIHDADLKTEYARSATQLEIKYIAIQDSGQAHRLQAFIDSSGDFESAVREYMNIVGWTDQKIPAKTINWGAENIDLEDQLYRLHKGDFHGPLYANHEYYVTEIVRVKKIFAPGRSDFNQKLPALTDRIRRRKIKARYSRFFDQIIRPELPRINWKALRESTDLLANEVEYSSDTKDAQIYQPKKLNKDVAESTIEHLKNFGTQNAMIFPDGQSLSIKEILSALSDGPYVFDYSTEKKFRRSIAKNIALFSELEALYKIAKANGYGEKKSVKRRSQMWSSYFQANAFRHALLQNVNVDSTIKYEHPVLTPVQKSRLEYMDQKLVRLAKKYMIKINLQAYAGLELNKQDMVVRKTHFVNRLVVPPLEPLYGLNQWHAFVTNLIQAGN